MHRFRFIAALLVGCLIGPLAQADNWSQFRGPNASGQTTDENLATEWDAEKNVAWKVEIPGRGWSAPIVWGDRVFVTTSVSEAGDNPEAGNQYRPRPDGPPRRFRPEGDRPEGDRPEGDRPRGNRPPRGERPEGDRPEGDRPRGDRPEGGRPRRERGNDEANPSGDDEGAADAEERPRRNGPPNGEGRPPRNREGQRGERGPGRRGPGGRGGFGRGRENKPPEAVHRFEVHCYDLATGDEIWKKVARESKPTIPTHQSNTYASETPVTDGEHVYAYFGMTGLYCYDLKGNLVWEKDLGVYPMQAGWGTSSSPVLHEGLLYIQVDSETDSFLVALDKKTGDEKWRNVRDEKSNWSSPIIWKNKERTELVAAGRIIRSYDPATGEQLWELNNLGGRSSTTPVGDDNMLYVGTEERNRGGYDDGGGMLFAIKAGSTGDITPQEGSTTSEGVVWSVSKSGLSMASPVVCQGFIYVLDRSSGLVVCRDASDGSLKYRKRISGARAFWASPWTAGDKIYCLDDTGTTHVLQAGPELKVVGKNSIDEQFWASSAIANGSLLLRGADTLYCIRQL